MAIPRIVVDGYNLIHAMPELARFVAIDLERARDGLVTKLAVYRARRNVRVTVVFDGRGAGALQTRPPGGVEVVFSRAPQNADAKIKNLVSLAKNPRSWTVVTSDNSIVRFARDYGANTIPSAEFAEKLGPGVPRLGPSRPVQQDAPLSRAEVAEWEELFRKGRQNRGG
ncbi:NYN domain-containing protein [candidate division WOR-3 bacterium]|nr:NYN domain-containing protein [candidate division WOR-3 bacterium]